MLARVKTVILEDGTSVPFSRFTVDELDAFADQYKAEVRAGAVKAAQEEKLSQQSIFNLKLELDSRVVDIGQLMACARSPKWMNRFLKKSLELSKVPADKVDTVISILTLNDKVEICEALIADIPEIEKHEPAPKGESPLA
jgi:hypothetical protein